VRARARGRGGVWVIGCEGGGEGEGVRELHAAGLAWVRGVGHRV